MPDDPKKGLSRRDFIRIGAAGSAALAGLGALGGNALAETTSQTKLPTRRYGRTGLDISALIGASDWNKDVIPFAVQSGVNYWHKAQRWNAQTMPEAIKSQPRESYYLECVVDRVDGDNAHGRIDEEQHYQFVKDCVQKSGAGYYDVFKFHYGYHSIEEAKTNPGMVKAYERLKKEGLVKHLVLSQHHYKDKDIGGDMAYDIVPYLMDNLPYEAAQFFYTYGDKKEIGEVIEMGKKKIFGTIAMKINGAAWAAPPPIPKSKPCSPIRKFPGSTPGAAMVKWLMSNPNLTAAVIAIKNFDEWQENYTAALQATMKPADKAALTMLSAYNKGLTCLLCADCVSHCSEHIAIADILRYERYAYDYHDISPRPQRIPPRLHKANGTSVRLACRRLHPPLPHRHRQHVVAKLEEVPRSARVTDTHHPGAISVRRKSRNRGGYNDDASIAFFAARIDKPIALVNNSFSRDYP